MPKPYARFKAKPEKAAAMPMRNDMGEHEPMMKAKARKKKGKKARAASRMK